MPSKTGVPASPSGSLVVKSFWPSRSDSLGIPRHFIRFPGCEAWCGVQNLHNSGRTSLVLLFSSLWVTHTAGMRLDFIMIMPLLPPSCNFFFVLDIGYLVLVGSSILLSMVVQQLVVILVTGGDEHTSSAILNQKPCN